MEDHLEGYRHLMRAEELWLLARRKQSFTNWYTKLLLVYILYAYIYTPCGCSAALLLWVHCDLRQSGNGLQVAEAWSVDVAKHFIRKHTYKGHRPQVLQNRLRVSFDGCTLPAAVFTATGS